MSWECRYLMENHCEKRNKPCDPGAPGCVLQGKFKFPLKEERTKKSTLSINPKSHTVRKQP
jgi:hypothetical protein